MMQIYSFVLSLCTLASCAIPLAVAIACGAFDVLRVLYFIGASALCFVLGAELDSAACNLDRATNAQTARFCVCFVLCLLAIAQNFLSVFL